MSKSSLKHEIAKNLEYYRKKSNLTQKDLAEKLGVKYNTISSWENEINSIDVEILFNICEVLDVSIVDMYGQYASIDECANFTNEEKEIIQKYRTISPLGKKVVNSILDIHYNDKINSEAN